MREINNSKLYLSRVLILNNANNNIYNIQIYLRMDHPIYWVILYTMIF